ncbi:hypothetical protein PI125_g21579 [Phytophthora idaei]|nr:hypothetical protein PI125_g21579 [Phytophthora idaei]
MPKAWRKTKPAKKRRTEPTKKRRARRVHCCSSQGSPRVQDDRSTASGFAGSSCFHRALRRRRSSPVLQHLRLDHRW